MNSHKKEELALSLDAIRKKHGTKVVTIASLRKETSYIHFGFPTLDELLHGAPRGHVTEIIGKPTSGATTLALNVMRAAQQSGNAVVYLDLASTYDPDNSVTRGLQAETLLLVRPEIRAESLDMLFDIVSSGIAGVIVMNSITDLEPKEQRALTSVIERLNTFLTRSDCALILIKQAQAGGAQLSHHAALKLLVEFHEWLRRGRGHDIYGYESQVTVLKNKEGYEGRKLMIRVISDEGNKGEHA